MYLAFPEPDVLVTFGRKNLSERRMILNAKTLMLRYTQALADHPIVATWVLAEQCQGMPKHFQGSTLLHIGLNMRVAIPDLRVDETGISGTLSFGRVPHFVVMPWEAVQEFMSEDERIRLCAEEAKKKEARDSESRVMARDGNVVKVRFGK